MISCSTMVRCFDMRSLRRGDTDSSCSLGLRTMEIHIIRLTSSQLSLLINS